MENKRTFTAGGVLSGPVDMISAPVTWGPLRFYEEDGRVHFELKLDVSGRRDEEVAPLLERVGPAVEAAVAAASGAAVQAHVSGWSYPAGQVYQVGSAITLAWDVNVGLDAFDGAAGRGQAALEAVLEGDDRRLRDLYEVYLLGVRAVQTVAPVVGLWAFSTILEEEAPRGKHNLDHVPALVEQLRIRGQEIPGAPARNLNEIRAAALHPSPRSPLPTADEVGWFRQAAHAYLLDRASRRAT